MDSKLIEKEEGEIVDDSGSPHEEANDDQDEVGLRRSIDVVTIRKGKKSEGSTFPVAHTPTVPVPMSFLEAATTKGGPKVLPRSSFPPLSGATTEMKRQPFFRDESAPKMVHVKQTPTHMLAKKLSQKVVEKEIQKDPVSEPELEAKPRVAKWGDVIKTPEPPKAHSSDWDRANDNIGFDKEMGVDPNAGRYAAKKKPAYVPSLPPKKEKKKVRLSKNSGGSKREAVENFLKAKAEEVGKERKISDEDFKKVLSIPNEWARGRLMGVLGITPADLEQYLHGSSDSGSKDVNEEAILDVSDENDGQQPQDDDDKSDRSYQTSFYAQNFERKAVEPNPYLELLKPFYEDIPTHSPSPSVQADENSDQWEARSARDLLHEPAAVQQLAEPKKWSQMIGTASNPEPLSIPSFADEPVSSTTSTAVPASVKWLPIPRKAKIDITAEVFAPTTKVELYQGAPRFHQSSEEMKEQVNKLAIPLQTRKVNSLKTSPSNAKTESPKAFRIFSFETMSPHGFLFPERYSAQP